MVYSSVDVCLSPTLIPNPNLGRKDKLAYLVDTESKYIPVPCGHCKQCVHLRQSSIVQRCQVEERTHHLFFCTLTYNNDQLPVVTTSTGYDIRYASRRDVTLMCKRLRKSNAFGRDWKYLAVSELGGKHARPHFHLIFAVDKYPSDSFPDIMNLEKKMFDAVLLEWRRNYGSTRSPIYKPLCTYVRFYVRGRLSTTYDLHYMNSCSSNHGNSDVAFYVTKYMFKPSDKAERLQQALKLNLVTYDDDGNPDFSEYEEIWNLVKPGFTASPGFGMADVDYVRSCIEQSKSNSKFPKFYNTVNGSSFPLSRYYYRKGVYNIDDATYFKSLQDDDRPLYDDSDVREFDSLPRIQDVIDDHDYVGSVFDEIFEK